MKYLIDIIQSINSVAIGFIVCYIAVYVYRAIGLFNNNEVIQYVIVTNKRIDYIFCIALALTIFLPSKEILTEWLIK